MRNIALQDDARQAVMALPKYKRATLEPIESQSILPVWGEDTASEAEAKVLLKETAER